MYVGIESRVPGVFRENYSVKQRFIEEEIQNIRFGDASGHGCGYTKNKRWPPTTAHPFDDLTPEHCVRKALLCDRWVGLMHGMEREKMSSSLPKIEILVSPGCAHADEAVTLVKDTLTELNLAADVTETMVERVDKAKELKFLGSPSIRVNGRDIEPGAEERQDYGLG
jgi:hypothetical protein